VHPRSALFRITKIVIPVTRTRSYTVKKGKKTVGISDFLKVTTCVKKLSNGFQIVDGKSTIAFISYFVVLFLIVLFSILLLTFIFFNFFFQKLRC